MSTPSIEDVLRDHFWHPPVPRRDHPMHNGGCYCGWQCRQVFGESKIDQYNAHLADAIRAHLAEHADEAAGAVEQHRDLVRRLGFGDNLTEPMADNDTIVAWFEEQGREAAEWRESQMWRDTCHFEAGHPDDEDCYEHDPSLRLLTAEEAVERVRELLVKWDASEEWCDGMKPCWVGAQHLPDDLRAALAGGASGAEEADQ